MKKHSPLLNYLCDFYYFCTGRAASDGVTLKFVKTFGKKISRKDIMQNLIIFLVLLAVIVTQVHAEDAVLNIPENGWRINTFKSKDRGANLSFLETPDGQSAIKAEFYGKGAVIVSLDPELFKKQIGNWPEKIIGLKGYFWNNGKNNWLKLAFRQKGAPGNFTGFVKMNHNGWKLLTVKKMVNFQDKSKQLRINPRETSDFKFSLHPMGYDKTVVGFGPLTWIPDGVEQKGLPFEATGKIYKTASPLELDGELDDAFWNSADKLPLNNILNNTDVTKVSPQNEAWVKAAFDDKNLYLAGKFYFTEGTELKDEITEFDSGLWGGEDIEFFIFPGVDRRKYYQLIVNPAGTRADLARIYDQDDARIRLFFKDWNGDWQAKASKHDNFWSIEAIVPWNTLDASGPPEILQFQAQRVDYTVKVKREVVAWCNTKRKACDSFGALILEDNKNEKALKISGLSLRRMDKSHLVLSGKIDSPDDSGKIKLKTWLSLPSSPSKEFENTIDSDGSQTDFSWNLDVGQCLNGFHALFIKVVSEASGIAGTCATFHFDQTIPPDIEFSDIYLNPVPKKLAWGEGTYTPDANTVISLSSDATPRTEKTAQFLVEKLYGHFGVKPQISKSSNGQIKLSVNKKKVKKEAGTDWHEAYLLDISSEGIEITGAGEAGLYYGIVTLGQMMNASKQPDTPLKAVSIKDWPTYEKRVDHVLQQFHMKKSIDGKDGYQISRMKRWIRNMVAGNKFNTLPFAWCDQINYPSRPELHNPANFTPEEISDLFAYAREHFIEVFPSIKIGGHSYGLVMHYPELAEEKFGPAQMDVTNPKSIELMKDLYSDIIKMSGPETKYFHTDNNEWWHKSAFRTAENFVHNGKNRQEIFRDFLMTQYKFLKEHNLRMIMMTDMLHPQHNGRPPWNLSEVAKDLPRDIILTSWGPSNEYFVKMGFKDVWFVGNGFAADSYKPCKDSKGFGTLKYLSIDSLFNHSNLGRWLLFGYHTELQAANYAWNGEEKESLPMPEWTMRYMSNLMGNYSSMPNPMAGKNLTTISFNGDKKLRKRLGLKNKDTVGDIEMELNAVKTTPEKPFCLDFEKPREISSLYILDAVETADSNAVKVLQQRYRKPKSGKPYGLRVGKYVLKYEDGTEVDHDILLGRNIALFKNTDPASRFIKEGRCLYPLKPDQSEALIQIEWVNPYPEKLVKSFEIISDNPVAEIVFCGLTVRDTKTGSEK